MMAKARQIISSGGKIFVVLKSPQYGWMVAAPASNNPPKDRFDYWIPRARLTVHCVPCKVHTVSRVIGYITQAEHEEISAIVSAELKTRARET